MPDILDRIDATIEQRCACGCGAALRPDGPSAYFARESCQDRWRLDQRDLARAERRRLREQRAGTTVSSPPTEVDREALLAAFRHVAQQLSELGRQVTAVMATLGAAVNRSVSAFAAVQAAQAIQVPPKDPRERALWHVRNRNTGPRQRQRAPRRIDPGRLR